MKVQEQVDFIKSHQQSILCGVGTPNRILKVWEEMKNQGNHIHSTLYSPVHTILSHHVFYLDFIDNVDLVVLDSSFVDQKKRTLITLEECRGDVWTLLSKTATLNNTENQKKIKLIIF